MRSFLIIIDFAVFFEARLGLFMLLLVSLKCESLSAVLAVEGVLFLMHPDVAPHVFSPVRGVGALVALENLDGAIRLRVLNFYFHEVSSNL